MNPGFYRAIGAAAQGIYPNHHIVVDVEEKPWLVPAANGGWAKRTPYTGHLQPLVLQRLGDLFHLTGPLIGVPQEIIEAHDATCALAEPHK